jgi:hypothetical protein
MIPRQWSLRLVVAVVVAAAPSLPRVARAQDSAAPTTIDKLVEMNKSALDDYGAQEWESAKETLLAAVAAGKRSGLETHPVMARTYIHLGAVYLTGFKDRRRALQNFTRALEIDPAIRIQKAMSTSELEDAFAEAARQRGRGGEAVAAPPPVAPPPPPRKRAPVMQDEPAAAEAPAEAAPRRPAHRDEDSGEPDLPLRVAALDCPTPDEVPPDKAVRLRCAVAANLNVSRVVLLFREPGREEFGEVEMEKSDKGWYQGKIPKKVVTGKSVQYYIEGRNVAGKALVSNGRSDSPNLILIRESRAAAEAEAEAAEAAPEGAVDTEENPLEIRNEGLGPRLYLGKVDKSRIGLDTRYGNRRFWIGLGLGTGYGYAKGNGLETRQDLQKLYGFTAGGGWAGLGQLAPEIGWQVTPDFAISIEGRNQWIPQSAKWSRFVATGAQSVLLRLLFFSKQSRLRFFGSLMGGGGEGVRFVVYPEPDGTKPDADYKDTVRGGPYLAGAGWGLYYEVTHGLSFVSEMNALAGLPVFSAVVDVNLALQINIY